MATPQGRKKFIRISIPKLAQHPYILYDIYCMMLLAGMYAEPKIPCVSTFGQNCWRTAIGQILSICGVLLANTLDVSTVLWAQSHLQMNYAAR